MQLKKLAVKIPFARTELPASDRWIEVMNLWIRDKSISGTLIDVADYSHMVNGPGIVLVAHEFILSLDHQSGWSGLRIASRRDTGKDTAEELKELLSILSTASKSLKESFDLDLDTRRIEISALDRLNQGSAQEFTDLANEVLGSKGTNREGRDEKSLPGVDLDLNEAFSLESFSA
jgi:hypothetical protein